MSGAVEAQCDRTMHFTSHTTFEGEARCSEVTFTHSNIHSLFVWLVF